MGCTFEVGDAVKTAKVTRLTHSDKQLIYIDGIPAINLCYSCEFLPGQCVECPPGLARTSGDRQKEPQ